MNIQKSDLVQGYISILQIALALKETEPLLRLLGDLLKGVRGLQSEMCLWVYLVNSNLTPFGFSCLVNYEMFCRLTSVLSILLGRRSVYEWLLRDVEMLEFGKVLVRTGQSQAKCQRRG